MTEVQKTEARSCLIDGQIMHCRFKPKPHRFTYKVLSMVLDLDQIESPAESSRLFSFNRFNLFSFQERDHGRRDGTALRPWVEETLAASGVEARIESVLVHCFPRMLGFVFDPLTVYWAYDERGRVVGVIYEVKNTFGDQHCYAIPVADEETGVLRHAAEKCFHVSPFFDLEGAYHFKIALPEKSLNIGIRLVNEDGSDKLIATHHGQKLPFTDAELVRQALRRPFNSLKVIVAIHFEALRLFLKGAKFHRKPVNAPDPVSVGSTAERDVSDLKSEAIGPA